YNDAISTNSWPLPIPILEPYALATIGILARWPEAATRYMRRPPFHRKELQVANEADYKRGHCIFIDIPNTGPSLCTSAAVIAVTTGVRRTSIAMWARSCKR
ncbi:hypothetical protein SCLCIDRAFT_1171209, partial [Scleroderma citrinum Foug A]